MNQRNEDKLRRFDLILDLRACMREWGDSPALIAQAHEAAVTLPLEELERVVARWKAVLVARRAPKTELAL